MSYMASPEEVAMFETPRYQSHSVGAELGFDRFCSPDSSYNEASVFAFKFADIEDVCASLEDMGYAQSDMDFNEQGFTYTSPDGQTEVYVDTVVGVNDDITRVWIRRGKISEEEVEAGRKDVTGLFNMIYGGGASLLEDKYYRDLVMHGGRFEYVFGRGRGSINDGVGFFPNNIHLPDNPFSNLMNNRTEHRHDEGHTRYQEPPRQPTNSRNTDPFAMPDISMPSFDITDPMTDIQKEIDEIMKGPDFDIPEP